MDSKTHLTGYCSNDLIYLSYGEYHGKLEIKQIMNDESEIKLFLDCINSSSDSLFEVKQDKVILTSLIPYGLNKKSIVIELLHKDKYLEKIDKLERKLTEISNSMELIQILLKNGFQKGEFTVDYNNINIWCNEFKPYIYDATCVGFLFSSAILKINAKLYSATYHTFEEIRTSHNMEPMKINDKIDQFSMFNPRSYAWDYYTKLKINESNMI